MSKKILPPMPGPLIETHCHLDYLKQAPLPEVLAQARAVGVQRIITIGVSPANLAQVRTLAQQYPEVWGTQGIHPHDAEGYSEAVEAEIRTHLSDPRLLAVGEIGLDYYYDHADRAVQRQVFARQLQLAVQFDRPVVIHSRDADADTMAILAEFGPSLRRKGVIHSFTAGQDLADFCLAEGFCLGFNGIISFNKADNVRAIARNTPLDRILLETDAPYLTPVPHRGVENAPQYLPWVAIKLAEVLGQPLETLLAQTNQNALALFWPAEAA